jgi:hypothetical protein
VAVATVLRFDPYRAFFYANSGDEPAHVHVCAGGKEAKIWLNDLSIAVNIGFSTAEIGDIIRCLQEYRDDLLSAWNERFGAYCGA